MEKIKVYKKEIQFHLLLNIFVALFITIACYVHVPFGTVKAFFIYVIHFLLLQFSVFGFIYILSLFKRVFILLFPILFLICACLSFWVYTQDISIDFGMIQAISETNLDIAVDVFSWLFLIYILLAMLAVFIILKTYTKLKKNTIKSPLFVLSILGIITFFMVENYRFGALKRRLPYSAFFSVKQYLAKADLILEDVDKHIVSTQDDLHIVFVLGESVRADHLSLNGYHRKTTPLLEHQKNIISYKNIYTPLTYTAISVPQILTDKSIIDTLNTATSLYNVLNKAAFKTTWIGNQSLEKSYKDIVNTNDKIQIIDKFHSVLSFKKEKDLEILNNIDLTKNFKGNKITTLHMIGSHWYYNSRFDENSTVYKPIVTSKYVGSSSKTALINSYDNTILYLDSFLNKIIEDLKKSSKNTILIYLSDHGEILGEDGKWFHPQKHKASENPAMLVWYSENFKQKNPKKVENLNLNKNNSISTDFLFYSILDLSEIKGFEYPKESSIFHFQ
ncbi:phosphoethanolamine transferase [Polaribacter sp. NJDZ03]|uniref:phosphoethanolamine transferase n=1 Tax=Polaribacter sp. NJDZ03 TaxID=2855841 RepID=UPI001C4A54A4|nr:phosphoethanolamine transferase [Polaribacter sp. NJDZ03]